MEGILFEGELLLLVLYNLCAYDRGLAGFSFFFVKDFEKWRFLLGAFELLDLGVENDLDHRMELSGSSVTGGIFRATGQGGKPSVRRAWQPRGNIC